MCDRCHYLQHNKTDVQIYNPSVDAIAATIAESPHKDNHVYHVIDAADFPMSLVSNLPERLHFSRMRGKNRRSKSHRFMRGGKAEMSFIVTRSDLLAPKKEMVDRMMPYLANVLREALGRDGHRIRLGALRCVSAKRGWWTKEVKEEIYRRGGGNWMVGRVNVGKSNLLEGVFPKGRGGQLVALDDLRTEPTETSPELSDAIDLDDSPMFSKSHASRQEEEEETQRQWDKFFSTKSLLPPAPAEVLYPPMPVISALPGTTASPIRLPFGNGKGELVDLPGINRHTLEAYVKADNKLEIIMERRVVPQRISLKDGQTLLLDGLVRITPKTPDLVFLTHSFVPLKPHQTATYKAVQVEAGERAHPLERSMVADMSKIQDAGGLKSAGTFQLRWDVTKEYSGPITRSDGIGLKPEVLPWITYAADILIEGCGWVEIHAQIRKRKWFGEQNTMLQDGDEPQDALSELSREHDKRQFRPTQLSVERFPEIEVFAPEGKFIGIRKPMKAYATGGPRPKTQSEKRARPRKSMSSVRRQSKSNAARIKASAA